MKKGADLTNCCGIHSPHCSFTVHENICIPVSGYGLEVNTKQTHEHHRRQLLLSSFPFFSRGAAGMSSGFNQVWAGHQCPTVTANCESKLLGTQRYRVPSRPPGVLPPRDRDLGGFCCPSGRRLSASEPGVTVLLTEEGFEAKAQGHIQCWDL